MPRSSTGRPPYQGEARAPRRPHIPKGALAGGMRGSWGHPDPQLVPLQFPAAIARPSVTALAPMLPVSAKYNHQASSVKIRFSAVASLSLLTKSAFLPVTPGFVKRCQIDESITVFTESSTIELTFKFCDCHHGNTLYATLQMEIQTTLQC